MPDPVVVGPEKATLVERFVSLLRVPYLIGSLILAALIAPIGQFITWYVKTLDVNQAFTRTFASGESLTTLTIQGVLNQATFFLYFLFAFYAIRRMRLRIVEKEHELAELASGGEESIHMAFGRMSSWVPPVVITLLFTPLLVLYLPSVSDFGAAFIIYYVLASLSLFVVSSTFVWVYFTSLRGLHKLGKEPLKLVPFYEDNMLGMRPFGSVSLSLVTFYFVSLSIAIVGVLTSPDPVALAIVGGFILLGVVLFFLPLLAVHRQMLKERDRWHASIQGQMIKYVQHPDTPSKDQESTLKDLDMSLGDMRKLIALQMTKENVNKIPTWPFDTVFLERLVVVILAVTATLIARYVGDLAGWR